MAPTPRTFEGLHSTIAIARPAPHVVLMTITGRDAGEHGDGPQRALDEELRGGPYALFIDARRTLGARSAHRSTSATCGRIGFARSKFVQLTADFVRRFAELGDAMHIYTDGTTFDEAVRSATQR